MDLRNLPKELPPHARCAERRMRLSQELELNFADLRTEPERIGHAEEKNCEQMFGTVPLPVGYAGPLELTFSSQETQSIHLPLATTEGALVASVNRGCKALTEAGGVRVTSVSHGISRSIAFRANGDPQDAVARIEETRDQWVRIGEATSGHLSLLTTTLDVSEPYVFLTLNADSDEAMGMNMITIAAQEIGNWIESNCPCTLITIAGNVDSDKKPSKRSHERGRGHEVIAEATLWESQITSNLRTTPEAMLDVADAKLNHGSKLAGAIGSNLHAANIIAALYLATGQDVAHTVEGSLTETSFTHESDGFHIRVRLPAVLVGVRGGGTSLPAQSQCLAMLLHETTSLRPTTQLAESIGAAVCAGELSLLAAQAAQHLASSHRKLAR